MKILMFAPIFPPVIGGPATQCASLCRALLARGYKPIVLTPGSRWEKGLFDGYPVYRYPWKYTGTSIDRFIRWIVFPGYFLYILARERPSVLHVHSVSGSSFIAGFFAMVFGIPSIIKFAGDWVWETLSTSRVRGKDFVDVYRSSVVAKILLLVERLGISFFTVIWAPSDFRRANVKELLGTDECVVQIPNSLLLPPGGVHMWHASEPAVVISANRFIPHKRVSMIVRAFNSAAPKTAKLVLIGGGDEKEVQAVRDEIVRTGLHDRVELTGILSSAEIYERFKTATLYVSASLEEGFPNVFIEAMHFGLPIVTTDAGGSREMVEEGKTGYLVDPADEPALTERMREVLADSTLRNRMAQAAQERSRRYDLTVVVDEFISLYERLVKKHS